MIVLMKPSLSVVFSIIATILCAAALVSSVRLPVSSLWRGYSVVYVPVEVEESLVLEALGASGIRDIISLSSQRVPLVSSYAPVQSITRPEHSYLRQRENYFFDRSRQMRLYYVPHRYMVQAVSAVGRLHGWSGGEGAGIEGRMVYPWIVPLISAVAYTALVFLSQSRIFMVAAGLFPLLFSCCVPSYSGAGASVLLMYGLYLCSPFWGRKDMLRAALKSPLILLFCLAGLLAGLVASLQEGLLLAVALAGSLALCHLLLRYSLSPRGFFLVPIRSAPLVSVVSSVGLPTLLIPAGAAAALSVALFFQGHSPVDNALNGLFLPAPARYTDAMTFDSASFQGDGQDARLGEELPSLVHYVDWVWDTLTYPYRSLHDSAVRRLASVGETVLVPSYEMTDGGLIQEQLSDVQTLDEAFITAAIEGIRDDSLQIERVLKTQNCFTSVVYRRMGDFPVGRSKEFPLAALSLWAAILTSLVAGIFIWRVQR